MTKFENRWGIHMREGLAQKKITQKETYNIQYTAKV